MVRHGGRGLEARDGPAGSLWKEVELQEEEEEEFLMAALSSPLPGASCRVVCERTSTDTRRPLATGQEPACAGSEGPCTGFQPTSCRAPRRPPPSSAEQVGQARGAEARAQGQRAPTPGVGEGWGGVHVHSVKVEWLE